VKRALAAAAFVVLALAGCSSNDGGIADTANNPDAGYVTVKGSDSFYGPEDRADPVDFTATTTDGETVDAADYRGKVLVLNFWYATCPPCRTEAPILDEVSNAYPSEDVVFLGVNVRDDAATANTFDESFGIDYPSVLDADTGNVQFALAKTIPANATPSTLVLDTEGRVAARMIGELESAAQLGGYIDAALDEAD
jgi:thiol-disulfide isomerase/thioredoxin